MPEFDRVHAVQSRVERGERQSAERDVGGHDPARVPGGVQGLDAAAGAEVEHRVDGRRDHQPRQRHRRATDAEHVIGVERPAEHRLAEVGRDPPAARAERVDETVGPQVEPRPQPTRRVIRRPAARRPVTRSPVTRSPVTRRPDEAERLEALRPEPRQCIRQLGDGHSRPQQEEPGQRRNRRDGGSGCPCPLDRAHRRLPLPAVQGGRRRGPPQRVDHVDPVARGHQVVAERVDQRDVGGGRRAEGGRQGDRFVAHVPIQSLQ